MEVISTSSLCIGFSKNAGAIGLQIHSRLGFSELSLVTVCQLANQGRNDVWHESMNFCDNSDVHDQK